MNEPRDVCITISSSGQIDSREERVDPQPARLSICRCAERYAARICLVGVSPSRCKKHRAILYGKHPVLCA